MRSSYSIKKLQKKIKINKKAPAAASFRANSDAGFWSVTAPVRL